MLCRVTEPVSFGILGRLKVVAAGRELSIPRAKQRALLAALLLARGRAISVTALVDSLWGPTPAATADHLIKVYVSDLRARLREIGLDDRLVTESPGYRLTVLDGELDADRFEALVSDPGAPVGTLRDALGLPTFEIAGHTLYKRLALIAERGVVSQVFYPVFPPDRNAADVVAALRATVS